MDELNEYEKIILKNFIEENWEQFLERVDEETAQEIIGKLDV